MASCAQCGSTIIMGGVENGGRRFCNEKCHQGALMLAASQDIPPEALESEVLSVFRGTCPACQGPGPVDLHRSHRVWSMIVLTQWQSRARISCKPCGVKSQVGDALLSSVAGWWGFPWGLVMTPVQVGRNVVGMLRKTNAEKPSEALRRQVGIMLGARKLQNQAQGNSSGPSA